MPREYNNNTVSKVNIQLPEQHNNKSPNIYLVTFYEELNPVPFSFTKIYINSNWILIAAKYVLNEVYKSAAEAWWTQLIYFSYSLKKYIILLFLNTRINIFVTNREEKWKTEGGLNHRTKYLQVNRICLKNFDHFSSLPSSPMGSTTPGNHISSCLNS